MMFDFHEYYDRIARQLPNDCKICEVGVASGDSIIFLAKTLLSLGKTFKIYGVDNMDYGGYIQMKELYENLIKNKVAEYIEIIPKDSLEAAKDFNDGYLDFVFIDSSHEYNQTLTEIPTWYKKVKDEGIFAGHDYYLYVNDVGKAVDKLIPKMFIRNDIEGREFEPEQVLHIENTSNDYGIWWCKKQWYLKLNNNV